VLLNNTFSGGSHATTITAGNSGGASGNAFNSVLGTPTYTSLNATGLRAPMAATLTKSSSDHLIWTGAALSGRDAYVRIYVFLSGTPTTGDYLLAVRDASAANVAILYLNTGGFFSVRKTGSTTDLALLGTSIPTGQWARVEAKFGVGTTSGNGSAEIRLYSSADSLTASATQTATSVDLGTTLIDGVDLSYHNGLTAFDIDDVALGDGGFIGPLSLSTPPTRITVANQAAIQRASTW
jgi:hypothetical protein